jgi:hypothetical protein
MIESRAIPCLFDRRCPSIRREAGRRNCHSVVTVTRLTFLPPLAHSASWEYIEEDLEVATLVLASRSASETPQNGLDCVSLRAWLREGWAVLFSHPNDVIRCDFEMDRWLVVTQRACAERGVRPLALAPRDTNSPAAGVDRSWVAQVSEDPRTVLLNDTPSGTDAFDMQARALRERIAALDARFVMVIDSALRVQRTFAYGPGADLPSPLQFVGLADGLRARQRLNGPEGRTVSDTRAHHLLVARRHKHRPVAIECRPPLAVRASGLTRRI